MDATPFDAASVGPDLTRRESGVGEADSSVVCATCHRSLVRRDSTGTCARCLASFVFQADDEPSAEEGIDDRSGVARTRRYGHFEILTQLDGSWSELGHGAMGTTYRAQDTVLHRVVALKVIGRHGAEHPDARTRFLREARAAAQFQHPNVASVSHYGEQDGECFYVMELVEGETLEARIRREGPLSVTLTLEIVSQIARALMAAEARGIIHRDLKPTNLMLSTRQGEGGADGAPVVKIIDFGLAKAVTAAGGMTGATETRGGFVGTPAFASPEQFVTPEETRIDHRSDIYSLGITMWYALSGRVPFVGHSLAEIHARQSDGLPLEQLAARAVPAPVVTLLKSMLAVDPAVRPQSARELLEELQLCRERIPMGPGRGHSPWKYRRAVASILFVAAVTLVCTWRLRTGAQDDPNRRSVAVLPFENLSPEQADAFFAVGVQDEITADLARVAALRVIGSESTRSYLLKGRDFRAIGRELGVSFLLEGTVLREGGQVHVSVRLVDVHDLSHVWNERYDRRLTDVFAVQGEITRAVVARLQITLLPAERVAIDAPPTSDLAAYDLFLRACEGPKVFKSPSEVRKGYASRIPLLEAAVARDPNFMLAYCELAKAHDGLQHHGLGGTAEEQAVDHRGRAEAALAQARRLQPDAGEVHLAQAVHFQRTTYENEQARIEVDLARKALPNNAEVEETAGEIARSQNRWDDAVRCLERAVVLEPRSDVNRFTLANTDRLLRHYDDFDRQMEKVISTMTRQDAVAYRLFRALGSVEQRADLAPLRAAIDAVTRADEPNGEIKDEYGLILAWCAHDADGMSRLLAATTQTRFQFNGVAYPTAWFEALAARMRGDSSGAQTAFNAARIDVDKFVQGHLENGRMLSLLAMIDAGLGNKENAVREARRACELLPWGKATLDAPVAASNLAVVYAWTGQPDLAFTVLNEWVTRPAGSNLPAQSTYGDLRLNPVWDPLRGDRRFDLLVQQLAPTTRAEGAAAK